MGCIYGREAWVLTLGGVTAPLLATLRRAVNGLQSFRGPGNEADVAMSHQNVTPQAVLQDAGRGSSPNRLHAGALPVKEPEPEAICREACGRDSGQALRAAVEPCELPREPLNTAIAIYWGHKQGTLHIQFVN